MEIHPNSTRHCFLSLVAPIEDLRFPMNALLLLVVPVPSALWWKCQSVAFHLLPSQSVPTAPAPVNSQIQTRYAPVLLPFVYRAVCLLTHFCVFVLKRNVIHDMGERDYEFQVGEFFFVLYCLVDNGHTFFF